MMEKLLREIFCGYMHRRKYARIIGLSFDIIHSNYICTKCGSKADLDFGTYLYFTLVALVIICGLVVVGYIVYMRL